MAKYRVETDQGTYEVETEDPPKSEGFQETVNATDNPRENMEEYPNSKFTDPSIMDWQTATGLGGLAKGAAALGGKAALRGVGSLLENTGLTKNILPTIKNEANEQLLKSVGASAGQIRKIGPDSAREAANIGRKAGMDDVFSTSLGRKENLANADATTGKLIGDLRTEAGTPGESADHLIGQVKQRIGDRYDTGVGAGQSGNYKNALDDVAKLGEKPSYNDIAKKATEMNDEAAKKGIALPDTAATKVTGKIGDINNQGIAQSLGSDKAKQYVDALHDESGIKTLEHLNKFGEGKEVAKKNGFLSGLYHSAMDNGGFRAASKGLDALHDGMTAPIEAGKAMSAMIPAAAKTTIGGVTAHLQNLITSNPQALGKYAAPLMKAAQEGGSNGIAATHYILSTTHPEYNQMMQGEDAQ